MPDPKFKKGDRVYEQGLSPSKTGAIVAESRWNPATMPDGYGYWEYYLDWPTLKHYGPYAESELR